MFSIINILNVKTREILLYSLHISIYHTFYICSTRKKSSNNLPWIWHNKNVVHITYLKQAWLWVFLHFCLLCFCTFDVYSLILLGAFNAFTPILYTKLLFYIRRPPKTSHLIIITSRAKKRSKHTFMTLDKCLSFIVLAPLTCPSTFIRKANTFKHNRVRLHTYTRTMFFLKSIIHHFHHHHCKTVTVRYTKHKICTSNYLSWLW